MMHHLKEKKRGHYKKHHASKRHHKDSMKKKGHKHHHHKIGFDWLSFKLSDFGQSGVSPQQQTTLLENAKLDDRNLQSSNTLFAVVDHEKCKVCGKCESVCAVNAIEITKDSCSINPNLCEGCGDCVDRCRKHNAIFMQVSNWGRNWGRS